MHLDLWTLALQTVNVLILVWLLAHFLFRPIAGVIAARRSAAEALIAEAEAVRAKAVAEAAALARQREGLAGDGERIVAAARASAETERASIVHQADDTARKLRDESEQVIARERQVMRETLEHEAADLALTIATRLLERLPVQMLNHVFLQGLAEVLATNPARALLARVPMEVRSAAPLDAAGQAECRTMLARLVGNVGSLKFRTDPTLVAGIELASLNVVIRNSWRADLERLTTALHEDASHVVA
jgi:F-type H+-transporting ATPase subunit b